MLKDEWDALLDNTLYSGRDLTEDEKRLLEDIINRIVDPIKSEIIVVDNQYYTKPNFKKYLYEMFYKGKRLEDITFIPYEQYISGMVAQKTLTGKTQYTFKVEGGKKEKEKGEEEYIPPTQTTIEGGTAKPIEKVYLQKFFETEERIMGTPKLYQHQEEALEAIRKYKKVSIQIPTGLGKTLIGIMAVKEFGTPALVIVPTTILMHQWQEEFRKYGVHVSLAYGGEKAFGEITITTYNTARSPVFLPTLKMYRVVIFDEVHHLYGDITRKILYEIYNTAEYIIGLSATTKKEYEKGYQIQERMLPTVVEKYPSSFKGTELEVPVRIVHVPVSLSPLEMERYDDDTLTITKAIRAIGSPDRWAKVAADERNEYSRLARSAMKALQDRRNILSSSDEKLEKAVEIIKSEDGQFIVFMETIAAAEKLKAFLEHAGITTALITSNVSHEDRVRDFKLFREGKIRVILSVFALEEGINIPDLDKAIWLGTTRKSLRYVIQRLGRITRPKPGKTATLYWIYALNTIEARRIGEFGEFL